MNIKRCYIDCETTGTNHKIHGLIQWSAKMSIDGELVDAIDLKIQPFKNDLIEQEALEANHIKEDDLWSPDRLLPRVAYSEIVTFLSKRISKFDRKDKAFFVGFNGKFDADFTREFFEKNNDKFFGSFFWYPILDVAILAGYLLQRERHLIKDFKLRTVFEYLNQDQALQFDDSMWHDSMFDIDRTHDIEAKLRERVTKSR